MSRGFPSMTALLGLLAVAGYQNRDKIAIISKNCSEWIILDLAIQCWFPSCVEKPRVVNPVALLARIPAFAVYRKEVYEPPARIEFGEAAEVGIRICARATQYIDASTSQFFGHEHG